MRVSLIDVSKNGIWLTFPPLLFSLFFMDYLPVALMPAMFNKDIPPLLINSENIVRVLVFAMPAFYSVGLSTKTQTIGLILYLAGIFLYYLSYGALIIFPDSTWSNSMIGVVATAYTNLFWMLGLGLLGEKFYFIRCLRYRSIFFIAPVLIFLTFHITHAVIIYQRNF